MKKVEFNLEKDGLYACYYPKKGCDFAFICLTSNDTKDYLAKTCVRWFHKKDINVLTMSPAKKDNSYHSLPLERFEKAIKYLKEQGNKKIGIIGISTTAMLALVAASYFNDITLTIAISPTDFVMEGFYIENGIVRLGDNESSVSYKGVDLPYLPMAYRHPTFNEKLIEEAKLTHNKIACRKIFNESEKLNPINEDIRIKVENIKGTILFIGAEDDSVWNTCKYIRRMKDVLLNSMKKGANARFLTYKHGTHFLLPESLLKMISIPSSSIPFKYFNEGKLHKFECKESRIDVDKNIDDAIHVWKEFTLVPDCKKKR